MRRAGTPDDIAAAAAFFCSEEASFVSGQVLYVAGGPEGLIVPWPSRDGSSCWRIAPGSLPASPSARVRSPLHGALGNGAR